MLHVLGVLQRLCDTRHAGTVRTHTAAMAESLLDLATTHQLGWRACKRAYCALSVHGRFIQPQVTRAR